MPITLSETNKALIANIYVVVATLAYNHSILGIHNCIQGEHACGVLIGPALVQSSTSIQDDLDQTVSHILIKSFIMTTL